MEVPVNYLAVLVAGVLSVVLGGLWYGPIFGKKWMALMGINPSMISEADKKNMWRSYLMTFVGALLMAYVLSHVLVFAQSYFQASGVTVGITTAFWSWLGFVAPVSIGAVLWEKKPWSLWFINAGYFLVSLILSGVILSAWT